MKTRTIVMKIRRKIRIFLTVLIAAFLIPVINVKAAGNIHPEDLLDAIRNRKETVTFKMNKDDIDYVRSLSDNIIPYLDEVAALPDQRGDGGDYAIYNMKRISVSGDYKSDGSGRLVYNISYQTNAAQEAELSDTSQHLASLLQGKSDYEKVKYIHDYICEQGSYDYTYTNYDAYSLLFNKTAVCEGYALAFYRLARAADLDCRIITGTASGDKVVQGTISEGNSDTGDNHAWNAVLVDGKWYNIDLTWDDQKTLSYAFFLKSDSDFSTPGAMHTKNVKFDDIPISDTSIDMSDPPKGSTPLSSVEKDETAVTSGESNSASSEDYDADNSYLDKQNGALRNFFESRSIFLPDWVYDTGDMLGKFFIKLMKNILKYISLAVTKIFSLIKG